MKPSEKLMLLLELNGYDVSTIRIKKQLEYEENGNVGIYKYYKFRDILLHHYDFEQQKNVLYRNPLNYHASWKKQAKSIDQFYISHPEIGPGVTLKEFINAKQVNPADRERIIHEVIEGWIEESRALQDAKIQGLHDVVDVMNRTEHLFKKPRFFGLLLSLIFIVITLFLTVAPQFIDVSTYVNLIPFLSDYITLATSTDWFLYLGYGVAGISLIYAISNIWYSISIKRKLNNNTDKLFDKLESDLKYQQFLQSKAFNEYVTLVMRKPNKSSTKITTFLSPNILVTDVKSKIVSMSQRVDKLGRSYPKMMTFIKWLFILSFLGFIAFGGIGYAVIGGYLNV